MPELGLYTAPYLDSNVWIAWIQGEKEADGTDRGKVAEHILTLAEYGTYKVTISALTMAEVYKPKGYDPANPAQNKQLLDYFEHEFVQMVMLDREIGLEANRIAATYSLNPNDAIHTACALRAECDVILTWDKPFWSKNGIIPGIRIERPEPRGQLSMALSSPQPTNQEGPAGGAPTGTQNATQPGASRVGPAVRGNDAPTGPSKPAAKTSAKAKPPSAGKRRPPKPKDHTGSA